MIFACIKILATKTAKTAQDNGRARPFGQCHYSGITRDVEFGDGGLKAGGYAAFPCVCRSLRGRGITRKGGRMRVVIERYIWGWAGGER